MARNIHSHPTGASAASSAKRGATQVKSSASPTPKTPSKTSRSAITAESSVVRSWASETPMDRETVSRLAYSYWEARGRSGGSPEEDWLRAEEELGGALN